MKRFVISSFFLMMIPAVVLAAPAPAKKSRARTRPAPQSIERQTPVRRPDNARPKAAPTVSKPAAATTSASRKASSEPKEQVSYYGRAYLTLMQEPLGLKSGANKARVDAQSLGAIFEVGKVTPLSGARWRSLIGFNFGAGTIRARGNTAAIADELKGQPWYAVGAHWGLLYRTTAHSEIKLVLPAYYRLISWSLSSASPLKPEKENSLSVGVGLEHLTRFSKGHALVIGVYHQALWQATAWNLGWQYDL